MSSTRHADEVIVGKWVRVNPWHGCRKPSGTDGVLRWPGMASIRKYSAVSTVMVISPRHGSPSCSFPAGRLTQQNQFYGLRPSALPICCLPSSTSSLDPAPERSQKKKMLNSG